MNDEFRERGDPLTDECGHKVNEDCMNCTLCGECREDLSNDNVCEDCSLDEFIDELPWEEDVQPV